VSAERVLVVDYSPRIRGVVGKALRCNGYKVSTARNVEDAIENLRKELYDLILIDIHTPGINEVHWRSAIRSSSNSLRVLFTVGDTDRDKAEAVKLGADDYLTKPFSRGELLARVRAVLRRSSARVGVVPEYLSLQGLEIDFLCREVKTDGHESRLTPKEFELLSYFVTHPNRVIEGHELLRAVWGPLQEKKVEYLRVFVNQLRKKIEPVRSRPRYLVTEPWVGYSFRMPR
jgi:two-component system, OmpR family, KDP operon response regulator KdpE